MPFTPFHFGPGLLVKGAAPRRFSWTSFVLAQVAVDCETLYYLVSREYPVHRFFHTVLGATLAGAAVAAALIGIRRVLSGLFFLFETRFPALKEDWSPAAVLAGGLIGGASHPFFDALMHPDMRPFAPFTEANPLLHAVGFSALHLGCLLAGLAGALWLWFRWEAS